MLRERRGSLSADELYYLLRITGVDEREAQMQRAKRMLQNGEVMGR